MILKLFAIGITIFMGICLMSAYKSEPEEGGLLWLAIFFFFLAGMMLSGVFHLFNSYPY